MIFEFILIATVFIISVYIVNRLFSKNQDDIVCGCYDFEEEFVDDFNDYDEPETGDVASKAIKRKVRKIWFATGTISGIEQDEFQQRVMSALNELSTFTATDFVQTPTRGGSYLQVYVASDTALKKKWRDPTGQGRVPLALQFGTQIWYRQADRRWELVRIIEAATIHEFGHRVGLNHSKNDADIMSINLMVTRPSAADKARFQQKLGKLDYKI